MHCSIMANLIICISHQELATRSVAEYPHSSHKSTVLNFHPLFDRQALILGTIQEFENKVIKIYA